MSTLLEHLEYRYRDTQQRRELAVWRLRNARNGADLLKWADALKACREVTVELLELERQIRKARRERGTA